MRTYSRTAAC